MYNCGIQYSTKNSSTDNPPDDRHRSDVVSETRLLYHCCSRIVINHKALSVLTYLLLSLAAQNANGALRNSDIVCLFHFLRLFVCLSPKIKQFRAMVSIDNQWLVLHGLFKKPIIGDLR